MLDVQNERVIAVSYLCNDMRLRLIYTAGPCRDSRNREVSYVVAELDGLDWVNQRCQNTKDLRYDLV